MRVRRVLAIVASVLVIDQLTKYIVRNSMHLGESIPVIGKWLRLTYTENPGIAFGITLGHQTMVPIVSILATFLIIGYLWHSRNMHAAYRYSIAVVLGGAIGNIIDRVFYGKLYGYGDFFQGRVVDFIHIDLWQGVVAQWVPFIGGKYMAFFPVWNVADMAIVIGMLTVLLLQYRHQSETDDTKSEDADAIESSALLSSETPVLPSSGDSLS